MTGAVNVTTTSRTRLVGALAGTCAAVLFVLTRPGLAIPVAAAFARSIALVGFPLFAAAICGWCAAQFDP
ncbi:MAG TPA: hypothetical protein VF902_00080, partial [Coriobacteriia bacterium]